MSEIDRLLVANAAYAPVHSALGDARPTRRLAVVTCMDARIDVFAALGLALGEAHVIRNAGARVTDDVLRSLALSTRALGTDTVVLMQHTKCGVIAESDDALRKQTGANREFRAITDHRAALSEDIDLIVATPYLEAVGAVAGFVYDLDTGAVDPVVRWERPG